MILLIMPYHYQSLENFKYVFLNEGRKENLCYE